MKIDFTMTYPCFVGMRSPDEPWTFSGGEDQAVAVHTDEDLLRQFLETQGSATTVYRRVCDTPDALIQFLRDQQHATSKGKPITHVIVDPTDFSKFVRTYPIQDFIKSLSVHPAH